MEELQWEEGRTNLWKVLRSSDPGQIEARIGVPCTGGLYRLSFLGCDYSIDATAGQIHGSELDPLARDPEFELLLLTYLLRAMHIDPSGKWVSEKQLPGGSNFFTGPHRLPVEDLQKRYGTDLAGFRRHCQALGGRALEYGDASFAFEPLPCLPLACVLWGPDEEFPPRSTLLFDSTIEFQLPLDMVLAFGHSFAVVIQNLP